MKRLFPLAVALALLTAAPQGLAEGPMSIEGQLGINPNNCADREVTVVFADGSVMTRDDLIKKASENTEEVFLAGEAVFVRVKVNANTLVVDGESVELDKSEVHEFRGRLTVAVVNAKSSNAIGHWQLQFPAAAR